MTIKFGIIGLGHWGTALANHLANKGYDVIGWTNQRDVAEYINKEHKNPNYLEQIDLSSNLKATAETREMKFCDYAICALPANALNIVLPVIELKNDAIFINATKGLDPLTVETPVELAKKYYPDIKDYAVLSGPGFAKDIVIGKPAGIVIASENEKIAIELSEIISSKTLKAYSATDVKGVELGGIVKNIIAIAAGVSDGLELGDSARAGIITRGLAEMKRLAEALGAKKETLSGLSGLGDLVLTATCDASRNRQVGLGLGKGKSLQAVLDDLGSTAEGVTATPLIVKIAEKHSLDLPITSAVSQLLEAKINAKDMFAMLMSRPVVPEF